jgi:8-oxo-dGTP pyrophosphatase MutT (NUDIX family)
LRAGPSVSALSAVERYRSIVDAHLALVRDGRLLWSRRANTGYADGQLALVSGHLEEDEDVVDAAIREAEEDVGIRLRREELSCVHVMHHRNRQEQPRIGFFFQGSRWDGDLVNREPHKCSELVWFLLYRPAGTLIPYPNAGIRAHLTGTTYSQRGWPG